MKMVEITQEVRHASDIYYPGERRLMEDEEADYFLTNGWGTTDFEDERPPLVDRPSVEDVTLKVTPGRHSSKSKVL